MNYAINTNSKFQGFGTGFGNGICGGNVVDARRDLRLSTDSGKRLYSSLSHRCVGSPLSAHLFASEPSLATARRHVASPVMRPHVEPVAPMESGQQLQQPASVVLPAPIWARFVVAAATMA